MDTHFETYVTRINYTLENIIAPQIQSDFIRSQVFSVMELLHQLTSRLEYRHDLLLEDINRLKGIAQTVIETFDKHNIPIQKELLNRVDVQMMGKYGKQLREVHDQMEITASQAIDLLYENRDKIKNAKEVEHRILKQITEGIIRDVMLFKPEMMHEVSKRLQEKEA